MDQAACPAHAAHIVMVRGDELPEGDFVTGNGGGDDAGPVEQPIQARGTHICATSAPEDHVAAYARGRVSRKYAER
jgi:hypothetical protein